MRFEEYYTDSNYPSIGDRLYRFIGDRLYRLSLLSQKARLQSHEKMDEIQQKPKNKQLMLIGTELHRVTHSLYKDFLSLIDENAENISDENIRNEIHLLYRLYDIKCKTYTKGLEEISKTIGECD